MVGEGFLRKLDWHVFEASSKSVPVSLILALREHGDGTSRCGQSDTECESRSCKRMTAVKAKALLFCQQCSGETL